MAITTSVKITAMKGKKTWLGKDHVIEQIYFDVTATDGTYSHTEPGVQYIGLLPEDVDNFVEFEDSAEFEAKVLEWAKPQSDPLETLCIAKVEELALDEEVTLEFTYNK